MAQWIKRDKNVKDFLTYTMSKTGKTPGMLVRERDPDKEYRTGRLSEAADMILDAGAKGKTICGVFDYDADGLCSAAETHLLFERLGISHTLTIPRRMTDGYGVNPEIISRFPDGAMLLTVDNGITGNEAFKLARQKGMTILVLDHHNAHYKEGLDVKKLVKKNRNVSKPEWFDLPDADLIIDPEALIVDENTLPPDGWDYGHYCGAGLVFKLAQEIYPGIGDQEFIDTLSTLAAIATIGDSVDVTADNARIIERGLACINDGKGTDGLREILKLVKKEGDTSPFDTESIAYYLAPLINAPGRLLDNGGTLVLKTLFAKGESAKKCAEKLRELNEQRKEHVADAVDNAEVLGTKIAFVYDETIPEGVCGIVAAKLVEKYHRPAFVMTLAESGKVKGSARCPDGENLLDLLRESNDVIIGFGGHEGAAGFSLEIEQVPLFLNRLESIADEPVEDDTEYYDFEVLPRNVHGLYVEQNQLGIFGHGMEVPVIKLTAMVANPQPMGADKTHLRFQMANTKCVAFGMAEKYEQLGRPLTMTIYGRVGVNWFKGTPSAQIQVIDMETIPEP